MRKYKVEKKGLTLADAIDQFAQPILPVCPYCCLRHSGLCRPSDRYHEEARKRTLETPGPDLVPAHVGLMRPVFVPYSNPPEPRHVALPFETYKHEHGPVIRKGYTLVFQIQIQAPFRADRLVISDHARLKLLVRDIRVGNYSQFINASPVPATLFNGIDMPSCHMSTANPGQMISLELEALEEVTQDDCKCYVIDRDRTGITKANTIAVISGLELVE